MIGRLALVPVGLTALCLMPGLAGWVAFQIYLASRTVPAMSLDWEFRPLPLDLD